MSTNAAAPAAGPVLETPQAPINETAPNEAAEAQGEASEAVGAQVAPDTAKAVQEAAKRGKKKFELKVDGDIEELELDLDNEEEIRKHLQLSKAAYKRMQESAEMRKGVQELLEALRTDPLKVLADPRLEIPEEVRKKLAESIINNEIEEMNKSPEQKEKERIQKEYERLKQELEAEKAAKAEAERVQLEQKYANELDIQMSEAISSAGLPKIWVAA